MKSRTLCACLAVMLAVSTFALAEILDDGDWGGGEYGLGSVAGNEYGTTAYGMATGDDSSGAGFGYGWHEVWTTERAICEYEYYLYTWAEANIYNYDYGYCRSIGNAEVEVEGTNAHPDPEINSYQDSYRSYAFVDEDSNPKSDEDGPYGDYVYSDAYWHDPGDGLRTDHEVLGYGFVDDEGSDAWTFSHADGRANCNLYEN